MKERGITCPRCGGTAVPVARVKPDCEGEELPIGGVFAGRYICVSCGKEYFVTELGEEPLKAKESKPRTE